MNPKRATLSRAMPTRVRNRREGKGLSGADLARRIGVSPAYVSQIEKGIRVPDVSVAVRIASALEDDEALYVAWCRDHKARSRSKTPSTDDDDAWTRLYRSDRFDDDDDSFWQAVAGGADIPEGRGRVVDLSSPFATPDVARREAVLFDLDTASPALADRVTSFQARDHAIVRGAASSLVSAPLLAPGKDPGERDEIPRQLWLDETLVDPRVLPGASLGRPFAFRADDEVSRKVRDRVEPGDLVIVSRDLPDDAPVPGRIYALRSGGKVFLGRLARFGDRFLVQPGPGETEMLDLGLTVGGPAKPAVAGAIAGVMKGG